VIYWLDTAQTAAAVHDYLDWIEQLRLGLNRRLFLGLFDYECHYAYYAAGTFYKKHRDVFKGGGNRVVSSVLYLNPHWTPQDGGELLLYARDGNTLIESVAPQYGRMILFLSEQFPHEVATTRCPRYSLAGWFRINNSIGCSVDPPG
jgi:SM-20-related protein